MEGRRGRGRKKGIAGWTEGRTLLCGIEAGCSGQEQMDNQMDNGPAVRQTTS